MKNQWSRNSGGHSDKTAGIAILNNVRDERKKRMAKKRNCRRTTDENIIHEKAVKMRRMTDEQLINYVENRVEKARSEGFNQGKGNAKAIPKVNVTEIVEEIGGIKGIGTAKLQVIRGILETRLAGVTNG